MNKGVNMPKTEKNGLIKETKRNSKKLNNATANGKRSYKERLKRDLRMNWSLYVLFIPVFLYYVLFKYKPMTGLVMAFENYSPSKGLWKSAFVGFDHFKSFLTNPYFWRLIRNTLWISISNLIFGFPAPIILALLLNEVRCKAFQRGVQLIAYLPHFISMIVICGLVSKFTADKGIINDFLAMLGFDRVSYLNYPKYFVPVYVLSGIWTDVGWSSIIYYAALTGIDQQLYEAASIDGAGRWKQTIHVTIPGIMPTITVMLILQIGNLLNIGYEKIILLYNPITYETADVISTYVYRKGILDGEYSYSTAVGLFNSVLSFILLFAANTISKKTGEGGLW